MSAKKVSRQRAWSLKMLSKGLCKDCGKPAVTKNHCQAHQELHNRRNKDWRSARKLA